MTKLTPRQQSQLIASRGDLTADEIEQHERELIEQASEECGTWAELAFVAAVVLVLCLVCLTVWGEASQPVVYAALYVLPGCCGNCGQGRGPCDCSRNKLDTDQMRATGVIEGPYRKTRPLTLTWRERLRRWWDANVIGDETWGDEYR